MKTIKTLFLCMLVVLALTSCSAEENYNHSAEPHGAGMTTAPEVTNNHNNGGNIGKDLENAGEDVKKAGEDAAKDAGNAVKDAGNAAENAVEGAKDAIETAGNAAKDAVNGK